MNTLTFDFRLNGYTAALTLSGENGTDLLAKTSAVIQALEGIGAEPTAPAVVGDNGRGPAGDLPEAKICPLHHAPMRLRHGKGGDTWYSHKALDPGTGQEYWCKGKERNGGG